jgi:1-aminocyclopropane-1-carboxylate deaminase/D-cysteine desulfhydrase-like pyridoxal-dependent ACC family enzyme
LYHSRTELSAALARQPRVLLANLPTPLVHAKRFSEAVGREIWIKRDDLTGLALGGNKVRKIEFTFGAGARDGFDSVVSVGASQSNHARTVAAAAATMGWECHLVLGGDKPERPSGNLVLDSAFGAQLHFARVDDWDELEQLANELALSLQAQGKRTLLIPMGGSTPTGALGFVAAYLELLEQCDQLRIQPRSVIHATSTGGTQAGLDLAHSIVGEGPDIIGVAVAKTSGDLISETQAIEVGLSSLLGIDLPKQVHPMVVEGYMGSTYARPTLGGARAFELLASTEAVLTDPVYTAKALHAVIDQAPNDKSPLIFWHTGGIPAIFSEDAATTRWAISVPPLA